MGSPAGLRAAPAPSDRVGVTAERKPAVRTLGSGAERTEMLYKHRPRLFTLPEFLGRNWWRFCT